MPEEEDLFLPSPRQSNHEAKSFTSLTESIIFILRHKEATPYQFQMKELAESLNEDLKRIYTLCNVFEGLGMVVRKGKNTCEWLGFSKMFTSLKKLQEMAEKAELRYKYLNLIQGSSQQLGEKTKLNVTMMTQKLLMLFLIMPKPGFLNPGGNKPSALFMEDAAKIIFGDQSLKARAASKMKLSDVCRVLIGLDLVSEDRASGRLGFRYEGPGEFSDETYDDEQMEDEVKFFNTDGCGHGSSEVKVEDIPADSTSDPV